ncbi:MAG: FTR1 family protein [Acidobacteria bacterium]|nr:FTR1 family protein [Acidobacteriota bacterium]
MKRHTRLQELSRRWVHATGQRRPLNETTRQLRRRLDAGPLPALLGGLLACCALLLHATPVRAATPWEEGLAQIESHLENGLEAYRAGNAEVADQHFSDAYFVAYEASGLEIAVRQFISAKRNYEIEKMFRNLRLLVNAKASPSDLEAQANQLRMVLHEDVRALRGRGKEEFFAGGGDEASGTGKQEAAGTTRLDHGGAFAQALLIILREGFEAILLLAALVAYVGRAGRRAEIRVIYLAAAAAVAASLLTAIGLNRVLAVSPARQEVIEGLTMLLASAVLFYVSYWLISKSESRRWQAYIQGKVDAALGGRRMMALGTVAFLAVYREGAETVLFYQALHAAMTEAAGQILAGFVAGSALLLLVFALFRGVVGRLPAGPFFAVTSCFLYFLAFVFAGKGIHELQEGGIVGETRLSLAPHVELLGIFPSVEGVAVQVLFIVALVLVAARFIRRARAASLLDSSPLPSNVPRRNS